MMRKPTDGSLKMMAKLMAKARLLLSKMVKHPPPATDDQQKDGTVTMFRPFLDIFGRILLFSILKVDHVTMDCHPLFEPTSSKGTTMFTTRVWSWTRTRYPKVCWPHFGHQTWLEDPPFISIYIIIYIILSHGNFYLVHWLPCLLAMFEYQPGSSCYLWSS